MKKNTQISSYKKLLKIKQKNRGVKMQSSQKKYLYRFFSAQKLFVIGLVILVFAQAFFEVLLPVWGRSYVRDSSSLLDKGFMIFALVALCVALLLYFFTAYFSIKTSRQLLVQLINRFREDWFRNFLESNPGGDRQAMFLTKVTYHFSLVQMGFTQTVLNLLYLVMMFGILVAFLPNLISSSYFLLLLFAVLYFCIFLVGRFFALRYITKEQTLTTHIIRHLVETLHNLSFIRENNLKSDSFRKLQNLVELDTYFRVRRGTWMSFSNRVLFGLILFFFGVFYVVSIYYPDWLDEFSSDFVISGIIVALFVRLMYSSLNIGIYSVPLFLGLKLSVPVKTKTLKKRVSASFDRITFRSKKVMLDKKVGYRKNVRLELADAIRVAIKVKTNREADVFTRVLSGNAGKKGVPWVVKLDENRFVYTAWTTSCELPLYIDPNFNCHATVGEIISGRLPSQIDEAVILKMLDTFMGLPQFEFLFDMKKKIVTEYNPSTFSFTQKGLLQIANAIFTQPRMLIIDSVWLQMQSPEIVEALELLCCKCSKSVIVTVISGDRSVAIDRLKFIPILL